MKFKNLLKSDFIRNSFTLLTGNSISQAFNLIAVFIMAIYFDAESIGVFSTLFSISTILSSFYSLQFDKAILVPTKSKDIYDITSLSFIISLFFFIVSFLLILIFKNEMMSHLKLNISPYWLLFLPIISLNINLNSLFFNFFSKFNKYLEISRNNIIESILYLTAIFSFGISFASLKFLIISKPLAQIIKNILYLVSFKNQIGKLFINNKIDTYYSTFRKYSNYPKITLPNAIFSTLTNDIPVILITAYYSPTITGLYFLCLKFTKTPISVLTSSFYNVYFVEFSKTKNKYAYFKKKITQTIKLTLPILLIIMLTLYFLDFIIIKYIKYEYSDIPTYLLWILPAFYFKFYSIFTTSGFLYYNQQKISFIIDVCNFVITIALFYFSVNYNDFELFLILILFLTVLVLIIKLILIKKIIKSNEVQNL